jgi:hypothetical protein
MAYAMVLIVLNLDVIASPQKIRLGSCHHHCRVGRRRDVFVVIWTQPLPEERIDPQENLVGANVLLWEDF